MNIQELSMWFIHTQNEEEAKENTSSNLLLEFFLQVDHQIPFFNIVAFVKLL